MCVRVCDGAWACARVRVCVCVCRCGDEAEFKFRFAEGNPPTLIATSVAAMLGKFLGWIDVLPEADKKAWAQQIIACQQPDTGWFDDADIADGNRTTTMGKGGAMVEVGRTRALLHRTRHAICALEVLGYAPQYRLAVVGNRYQGR